MPTTPILYREPRVAERRASPPPTILARFRAFWPLAMALAAAAGSWLATSGFASKTPAERFASLEQADQNLGFRVDSISASVIARRAEIERRQDRLESTLDALLVLGCIRTPPVELQKTRLAGKCRATLDGGSP